MRPNQASGFMYPNSIYPGPKVPASGLLYKATGYTGWVHGVWFGAGAVGPDIGTPEAKKDDSYARRLI